jgi:hypothetical protein
MPLNLGVWKLGGEFAKFDGELDPLGTNFENKSAENSPHPAPFPDHASANAHSDSQGGRSL